jgi:hypothetical protein
VVIDDKLMVEDMLQNELAIMVPGKEESVVYSIAFICEPPMPSFVLGNCHMCSFSELHMTMVPSTIARGGAVNTLDDSQLHSSANQLCHLLF